MADANLNYARAFMKESVVHDIGLNVQHILYAYICTDQARGKYKGYSRGYHVIITPRDI